MLNRRVILPVLSMLRLSMQSEFGSGGACR